MARLPEHLRELGDEIVAIVRDFVGRSIAPLARRVDESEELLVSLDDRLRALADRLDRLADEMTAIVEELGRLRAEVDELRERAEAAA